MIDLIHPYPIIKNILSGLLKFLWTKPAKYGFIVKLDANGNVIETLQNPDTTKSKFFIITGVNEYNDFLYFASIYGNWISKLKLK